MKTVEAIPVWIIHQILPSLCHVIVYNEDVILIRETLKTLGYLASFGEKFIQLFLERGIVEKLVELIENTDAVIVENSLSVINKIASGTDEQRQRVLDLNVLLSFHNLVGQMKGKVQWEALNFLMIILSGSQAQAQTIIDAGFLKYIIERLLKGESIEINAVKSLSKFIKKANSDQLAHLIQNGATLPLSKLLTHSEEEISKVS